MTKDSRRFRIATYNIHKCRGIHGRTSPDRIIAVIQELEADVLCLQEVVNAPERGRINDQAGEIVRALPDYSWAFGANRAYRGGTYGNMTLTRFPLLAWKNHDIARRRPGREQRGVLQTEIEISKGETLHLFNVHLGTGFMERRYQAKRLIAPDILTQPDLSGPRLVIGDFNEWTKGLTTQLLQTRFQSFRPRHVWRYPRTFPGILPILSLDHLYYEPPLALEKTRLWRTPRALIASDHLPLVADFRSREQDLAGSPTDQT